MKLKRILTIFVCFLMLSVSYLSVTAEVGLNEESLEMSLTFEDPTISEILIDECIFDQIELSNCPNLGSNGDPLLPIKTVSILLPPQSTIKNIDIESTTESLGLDFNILPAYYYTTTSQKENFLNSFEYSSIYCQDSFFPESIIGQYSLSYFRGYCILTLNVAPVQYNPVSQEILFHQDIDLSIEIQTDSSSEYQATYRGFLQDRELVCNMVDNSEFITSYGEVQNTKNNHDLLILTTPELEEIFSALQHFHTIHGLSTLIKTTDDIGASDPESIRDYIRQIYEDEGIDYVLLGGDDELIPTKILYCYIRFATGDIGDYVASDMYYSCLEGPFNYDGDDKWGESNDGEYGSDVDLKGDVFVGRAPVNTELQAKHFIQKTINYCCSEGEAFLDNVLLAGEALDESTYAGNFLDQLIDHSNLGYYSTDGIPSSEYNIVRLYDRDEVWSSSDVINLINSDQFHFINHQGHSNTKYCMKMTTSKIGSLTNEDFFFFNTVGCFAGDFDGSDCFCEAMILKPCGAFASIGNSRYGVYNRNSGGPGTRFQREFYDAVFDEQKTTIGEAHQDSKNDCIGVIQGDDFHRYVAYGLNLFGDPTIDLLTHVRNTAPEKPSITADISSPDLNEEVTFSFSLEDFDDEDLLGYEIDWGNGTVQESNQFFENGEEIILVTSFPEYGIFDVCVRAVDYAGQESEWSNDFQVSVINSAPLKPETPQGETDGKTGQIYRYETSAIDENDHELYYQWDWDDGSTSNWLGPYDSGDNVFVSHTFEEEGSYSIRVRCRDEYGLESEWSDPLAVSMPRILSFWDIVEFFINGFLVLFEDFLAP